jgi:hypothetical protein
VRRKAALLNHISTRTTPAAAAVQPGSGAQQGTQQRQLGAVWQEEEGEEEEEGWQPPKKRRLQVIAWQQLSMQKQHQLLDSAFPWCERCMPRQPLPQVPM